MKPDNGGPLFVVYDGTLAEQGSLTISANGTTLELYGSTFTTSLDLANNTVQNLEFCYNNGIMSLYQDCQLLQSQAFALPYIPAPSGGGQVIAYIGPFEGYDGVLYSVSLTLPRISGIPEQRVRLASKKVPSVRLFSFCRVVQSRWP